MRRLLAVLLIALLAPGLAGCFGKGKSATTPPAVTAEPSAKTLAVLDAEQVWVTSTVDGKRLDNAVYRPDTESPVPVFINFSPYWGNTAMDKGDAFAHYMIDEYVARGFAVVLSAVRGTGHSEGCFQIGGDLELQDSRDVVDYFAKQPWSTGAIAAGGKSYDSTTQNGLIAKFPPAALKGLFHVSGITDMYRYNYFGGVPYQNGLEFTPRYFATQGLDEYASAQPASLVGDKGPEGLMRLADDLACTEMPKHFASGEGAALDGIKDAYWQERDWTKSIAKSDWNGSIFFVHGLQDWNVKPDDILPWLDQVQANGHIQVFAWLHQWSPAGSSGHVYPMRDDWNRTMLQWLDHTLKGKANGWTPGFEVDGSDTMWRASRDWPEVPGSNVLNVTSSDGTLPFTAGARITGAPILRVGATPLTADPVLHATWYDVAPNGTITWVNEAVRRGALTDDLTAPRLVTPGSQMQWDLLFYPMDTVLAPGHFWMVKLGTPPTGVDGGSAGFVITPAQEAVQYNQGTMSLQVRLSDSTQGLVVPQPTPMKCFTC